MVSRLRHIRVLDTLFSERALEGNRKLAAILAADVAGYSRLMGDDEAATVGTLTEYRKVFTEHSARHGGRVVDTAGDSVLAVFESAVEAVECAAEIQKALDRRNRQLAEHRRMQFRIGINLGDVIAREDGTVYGDGVNIAARLESLADPGGLCVSGTVYDHVEGKVLLSFKFAGEQTVKNIAKPVRAYHVVMDAGATASPAEPHGAFHAAAEGHQVAGESAAPASRRRRLALTTLTSPYLTVAMALLVVLASGAALWIWMRSSPGGPPASMRQATIYLTGHAYPHRQASWFALSRDGLLVYSVEGSTDPMLSRRLDAPTPQPVDGTSGGATPFLSPARNWMRPISSSGRSAGSGRAAGETEIAAADAGRADFASADFALDGRAEKITEGSVPGGGIPGPRRVGANTFRASVAGWSRLPPALPWGVMRPLRSRRNSPPFSSWRTSWASDARSFLFRSRRRERSNSLPGAYAGSRISASRRSRSDMVK